MAADRSEPARKEGPWWVPRQGGGQIGHGQGADSRSARRGLFWLDAGVPVGC